MRQSGQHKVSVTACKMESDTISVSYKQDVKVSQNDQTEINNEAAEHCTILGDGVL